MIANYGYEDASGNYYIQIDTAACAECSEHPCINACPEKIFYIEADDFDDEIASVKENVRNSLKYTCASCKGTTENVAELPCLKVCPNKSIKHSW